VILAATLILGLALLSAQVIAEWCRIISADVAKLRWGHVKPLEFRPHPRFRLIHRA
jgi:hypothetical protein